VSRLIGYHDSCLPHSADNFDRNQAVFSALLAKGLGDALGRGLVGTTLVKVSIAAQDPAGNLTTTMYE
jgi:hypothetical protein